MAKSDSLYERVGKQCNAEQIRGFLRQYKEVSKETKKEIHLSSSKEDLLLTLSRGVAKGIFNRDDVIGLLRECEENGEQHIFYFKPLKKSVTSRCRDFETIREALLGEEWLENFPIFEFAEGEFQLVDVRCDNPKKPKDWVVKVYGHERYFEQLDVNWPSPDRRVETYAAKTVNVVCLARWNDPDVLEIRIDSQKLTSVKGRLDRLQQVWNLLNPALEENDFAPWDLTGARSFMAQNRVGHPDFVLGDLRLIDPEHGVATFKTNSDGESIDDQPERLKAINALASVSNCDVTAVHWKIPARNGIAKGEDKELATLCGGRFSHEMYIRARTTSQVIDHVTNKLRVFDGQTA